MSAELETAKSKPSWPVQYGVLLAQRLALLCVVVLLWQLAAAPLPRYVFPQAQEVAAAFVKLCADGTMFRELGVTLYRVFAGFVVASAIGIPFGVLLGSSRVMAGFLEPVLPVLNSVSAAIWAIIAVIWFGLSNATPIFVVAMTGLPLIATNVWQGTRSVNAEWIELGRAVHMPTWKVLLKVHLPAILPYFFSAARLAFGFGWKVSITAEALGSSSGVGFKILQSANLVLTTQVFAWTIGLIITMLILEWVVIAPIERHLFRWQKEAQA